MLFEKNLERGKVKKLKYILLAIFLFNIGSYRLLQASNLSLNQSQGEVALSEETDSESGETEVALETIVNDCFAVLVGDEKGNIYVSEKIREKWPLASITKMMTLLVTYDEITKGNIKLSDRVAITKSAAAVRGSSIPLKEGDRLSLEDLMKASGIHSANNATYAIANYVGGSVPNFIKMMNDKAKSLGLGEELEFHTPAGLPTHMTKEKMDMGTAYGIYRLALEYNKNSKLMSIASTQNTTVNGGKIKLRNRNRLLGQEGIYGIKTGYHSKSGYNIAVVSKKENTQIFTIVFGGKSARGRDGIALKQVTDFKYNYAMKTIVDENVPLVRIPVIKGEKTHVELYPAGNFAKAVSDNENINIKVKRISRVVAPVKKDEVLGTYTVYIEDEMVYEGELKVKENIRLQL